MALGNTAQRIIVSAVTIPLIVAVCYLGGWFFFAFASGIALISLYEFYTFSKNKGANPNYAAGFFTVILFLLNEFIPFVSIYYLLLIIMIILLIHELFRNKGSAIVNIGTTLLGIFYIGLFAGSLIGIREFYPNIGELYLRGGLIIISVLASIWICDSAAFFGGVKYGKHKLFPRVSPNKSWEGAIFGFFFAIFSMILAKFLILDFLDWPAIITFGIIVGTIGQIGDLIESLVKRDAEVKDSSNLIPGHGGIFDRFDSLLLSAPAVLIYLNFFGR